MYKVAIIGAGSIGALKDDNADYLGGPDILTHANAVKSHLKTELCAVVDLDTKKLEKVIEKWNPGNVFNSVEQMYQTLQSDEPDIVIVSTPTSTHYKVLNDILKFGKPRLIVAEKPFCNDLKEAQTIIDICTERKIPVVVDYIRRFSKGHQKVKNIIDSGNFGKVQNCRVLYGRGIKHDGCHAIDICNWFFGDLIACAETNGNVFADRDKSDPSYDIKFMYEKCNSVIFQACDARQFGIFEIDIILESIRIRLIENGLFFEIYPIEEKNKWGHASLNYSLTSVIRKETGLNLSLYELIDNCYRHLENGDELICTANDALNVHNVINQLIN